MKKILHTAKADYNKLILFLAFKDAIYRKFSLTVLVLCLLVSSTFLFAITTFKHNIVNSINDNSKLLLGADFLLSSRIPPADSTKDFIDNLDQFLDVPVRKSSEISFASMILFESKNKSRLVNVVGASSNYPLYGKIELEPSGLSMSDLGKNEIYVDQNLQNQYLLDYGDTVQIGSKAFTIKGFILQIPGSIDARSSFAPRVIMNIDEIAGTMLLRKGSIARYNYYYQIPSEVSIDYIKERISDKATDFSLSFQTHVDRGESFRKTFSVAFKFFDLVALISMLLGALGIVSGVNLYLRKKEKFIDTINIIGFSKKQSFFIVQIQVLFFGIIAILIGLLTGLSLERLLPSLFHEFLPFNYGTRFPYLNIILSFICLLLIMLTSVFVPSMFVSKNKYINQSAKDKFIKYFQIFFCLFLVAFLAAWLVLYDLLYVFLYLLGIFIIIIVLWLLSIIIRKLSYYLVTSTKIFSLEYGIKSLHRPNNQTFLMLIAIGLCSFAVFFTSMSQDLIIAKVSTLDQSSGSNLLLFDVQEDQRDGVRDILDKFELPLNSEVPIVNMRLSKINNELVNNIRRDKDRMDNLPEWMLTREYRSSFKEKLDETEIIVEGEFINNWKGDIFSENIPISIEKGISEKLKLGLEDTLTFSVQGVEINTVIRSIREVDWQQLKPNFYVLFPLGVLEDAPKTFIMTSRYEDQKTNVNFQSYLVQKFGNVSAIDLSVILKIANEIISQLRTIINFFGVILFVSVFVLLFVIMWGTRSTKTEEIILLKIIGADSLTIRMCVFWEYFFLSIISIVAGFLLSLSGCLYLSYKILSVPFVLNWINLFYPLLILFLMPIVSGFISSSSLFKRPSLEVLRSIE